MNMAQRIATPRPALLLRLLTTLFLITPVSLLGASPAENTAELHRWLDARYDEELQFFPETLTVLGRHELYDQLDDVSAEGEAERLAWYEQSVAALRERFDYDALDSEGQTSFDFWVYRLERKRGDLEFHDYQYPMTQIGGPHTDIPLFLINYHQVETVADMEAYIARLAEFPRVLEQTMVQVKHSASLNVRPPRFAQQTILDQSRIIIDGAPFTDGPDSPLWEDARFKLAALREGNLIDDDMQIALSDEIRGILLEQVAPAYAAVIDWFSADIERTSDTTPGALTLPNGAAYYAERLRYFTTTDLSAAEIHQLGLDEVERIQRQIRAIMADVKFEGSLQEFFDFVRDSDRFYYPDTDAGRQAFIDETERYLALVNEKLPEYFGLLPHTPLVVRRVEAFRELDGAAAFYEEGTADGQRPGVYYMHLSDMHANNRTDLQTTAYHEGNPGHHMQIAIAHERNDLPFFRTDVWYSGYGEGWALYAEQVAAEMGVYDDPYYEFGRLVSEIFRAIRLVVDTGIHALGWSEEEAVQYMLAHSAIPEPTVRSEIRRYITWPGQATSYKVGMLKILELREFAQAMLGDSFDIRSFHDTVLAGGSLPLEILERRVHDWVASEQDFQATVRRGSFGVAHISARNFGSLGYGEGYAAAEDHLCNIAYSLVEARGEKARYFGPGTDDSNLHYDAVVHALGIPEQGRRAFAEQPARIRRWLAGYSAGYNRFVREHPGTRNSSWCSGAPWVQEVSPIDFTTRLVAITQTLPRMSGALTAAQPPGKVTDTAANGAVPAPLIAAALDNANLSGMGSNAWAIGRELSENGRGLLLGNPHYPWYGPNRFWEKHLTIPGELDVYGVGLIGSPGVLIGFNDRLGWSHTVSASQRIVLYRLQLLDDDPLAYRYGDATHRIEARDVVLPVLAESGAVEMHRQTLYFSHHGPLLTLPGATWGSQFAYAVRDANENNNGTLQQWLAMGQARSMDGFIDAHRRYNAMPWVNTIAASRDGRALYLDNSTVGHLSAEAQQLWRESLAKDPLAAGLYEQRGLVLLNGSDPTFAWLEGGDAPLEGTTPFDERPLLERADYVFNSNDSYWLTSPRQPLTGYSPLYGRTESARSLRTRMNIRMLENRYGDAGEDGRFNRREIQQALFSNRGLAAELLLQELTEICRSAAEDDATMSSACDVLAAYDGTLNLDSPGAVLFREWVTRYQAPDMHRAGSLFSEEFNPERGEATPYALGDREVALEHLREALDLLAGADIAIDATLGDTQFAYRAGRAIAIHGGTRLEGVANLQVPGDPSAAPVAGVQTEPAGDSRYLTSEGYPVVHGSSFIMTLAFDDDGPVADALLSYSQSGNPNSQHFADQTMRYARKAWRSVAFREKDVAADTKSIRVLRSGNRQSP